MKNRILVFLVFITTILKGQSVDPETFPTVVGSVLGKNVYTNTGGEGKFSVQSIADEVNILDTISATYAEFYTLITGGNLQVGRTYILVDFQTVYDQMDFDAGGSLKPTLVTKTGATEQIWVLALSSNQIASKAYSATYPKDQIQYDWTYNTTLVNGSPAKGRISERIDENNNRTDYDHREIKFIRYDDGNGNFVQINDSGRTSQEFLTFVQNFTGGTVKDNWLGDFYSVGASVGQEYANNVFNGEFIVYNKSSSLFYNNTLFGSEIFSNVLSGNINNNIIYDKAFNNNVSGELKNNIVYGSLSFNLILGDYNDNIFNNDVGYSNLSGSFSNNLMFCPIQDCNLYSVFNSNTVIGSTGLSQCTIESGISGKTIDDITYPILFGNGFKKEILKGSDNNDYIKTFDGTIDQYILIP